jgi:hypothetical protein
MDVIRAGTSLLLSESPGVKPHLWFVVTDPEGTPGRVVAVMMRSAKKFTDETVVLEPGDHAFVKHQSSVHYSSARWFDINAIDNAMRSGRCHLRENMTPELLSRVRNGLLKSPFTVHAVSDYCRTRFASKQ